ncbi:MAG: hypothetical protein WC867_04185 [Candidatus Pacearchaeota archaeon]|jgi:hypothetical protein
MTNKNKLLKIIGAGLLGLGTLTAYESIKPNLGPNFSEQDIQDIKTVYQIPSYVGKAIGENIQENLKQYENNPEKLEEMAKAFKN